MRIGLRFVRGIPLSDSLDQDDQSDGPHDNTGCDIVKTAQFLGDVNLVGLDVVNPAGASDKGQKTQDDPGGAVEPLHAGGFFCFFKGLVGQGDPVVNDVCGDQDDNCQAGDRNPYVKVEIRHNVLPFPEILE